MALAGCASVVHEPIQTGLDRYQINGLGETALMRAAEQHCKSQGMYVHLNYSDATQASYFCMRPGERIVHNPSIDVDVTVMGPPPF